MLVCPVDFMGPDWGSDESQNHRIFGVGRDLCGSSSPTPLPNQGRLHEGAQLLF